MKLSSGAAVVGVPAAESAVITDLFPAYRPGLVRVGVDQCLLPEAYTKMAEQYLNFEFRSTDLVILTYPKCGTTWTQEILWTMVHNPDLTNLDAQANLETRSPFLEFDPLTKVLTDVIGHNPELVQMLNQLNPSASPEDGLFLQLAKSVPDVRIIKSHLPFSLLPPQLLEICKVVYVSRNPKDLVCSYLHHSRLLKVHDFKGTDEQFVEYFLKGNLLYGNYAAHLAEATARAGHRNLLTITYEQLKRDNLNTLQQINTFIGTQLSRTQIKNVAEHSSFSVMKKRVGESVESSTTGEEEVEGHGIVGMYDPKVLQKAGFFRKGETGCWKSDLSDDSAAKVDQWTQDNITKALGITFTYEG